MKALMINSNIVAPFCALYNDVKLVSFTSEFEDTSTILANKRPDKLIYCLHKISEFSKDKLNSVDIISVNIGPGSFTSIRVGLSIAKGVSLALNKKLVALPDFDINYECIKDKHQGSEYLILIISKLPEFYYSLRSGDKEIAKGLIDLNDVSSRISKDCVIVGNFDDETVKKLNYFKIISLNEKDKIVDAMYRLTDKHYKENMVLDAEKIEPLYMKNFTIKS